MSRPRKYYTKEQQAEAKKARQKKYYQNHREEIIDKNLTRYHEGKSLPDDPSAGK